MRRSSQQGFTLIELMIVVVVIGILAAIAIPNFISMQARAREGNVKANMHTLQVAIEDYSIQNDSAYPISAGSVLPDGRTLQDVCPSGVFPLNPFTRVASIVQWNANPASGNPGELGLNPANAHDYLLKANGARGDTLRLVLTTGQ